MAKLSSSFFERGAEDVAKDLLGKILVHKTDSGILKARIVETEAYVGTHDLACHASKGRTARTEPLFGQAGRAYIYLIYGIHELFNVVCSTKDDAQAVLVRAGEAINFDADLAGPGKFGKAMKLTRALNCENLCGPRLYFLDAPTVRKISKDKRIGVDFAKEWAHRHLRFYDSNSREVSKF